MQKIALKLVHLKRLLGKATNAILNYDGVQGRGTKVNPPLSQVSESVFLVFHGLFVNGTPDVFLRVSPIHKARLKLSTTLLNTS